MLKLHCCGDEYYADERHIGRQVKCNRCGRLLTIEMPLPLSATSTGRAVPPTRAQGIKAPAAKPTSRFSKPIFAAVWLCLLSLSIGLTLLSRRISTPAKTQTPVSGQSQTSVLLPSEVSQVSSPARIPVSLPTGTWLISPRGGRGRGVLKIHNGTDLDAVVKFVTATPSHRTRWKLYVRADDDKTVNGIGIGSYLLRFALGRDWDVTTGRFLRSPEFFEAGEPFDFAETETALDAPDGYIVRHNYDSQEIWLNPILNGNLPREPIDESVFNEGDFQN